MYTNYVIIFQIFIIRNFIKIYVKILKKINKKKLCRILKKKIRKND